MFLAKRARIGTEPPGEGGSGPSRRPSVVSVTAERRPTTERAGDRVMMPDIGGWETLARVRADPHFARLPFVMCTAEERPEDALLGWSLGCDGDFVKPFNAGVVVPELRRLPLSGQEAREARRAYHLSRIDGRSTWSYWALGSDRRRASNSGWE